MFANSETIAEPQLVRRAARVRTAAAAAVCYSTKASGRRVALRGSLRARRARFLLCAPALPRPPRAGNAPLGARRALRALEYVKEVLTKSDNIRCQARNGRGFGWSSGLLPGSTLTMGSDNTCLQVPLNA